MQYYAVLHVMRRAALIEHIRIHCSVGTHTKYLPQELLLLSLLNCWLEIALRRRLSGYDKDFRAIEKEMKAMKEQIAALSDKFECLETKAALKDTATLDRSTRRFSKRTELKTSTVFNASSYCQSERTYQYHPTERRRPPLEQLKWERGTEMDDVYEVGILHCYHHQY